jgi:hypothetical protein
MGAQGLSILDFGSAPGTNFVTASISVPTILSSSAAEAFFMGDSTVSGSFGHNSYEHLIAPIKLVCSVSSGVGFTIFATSDCRLTSTFVVRWVWN